MSQIWFSSESKSKPIQVFFFLQKFILWNNAVFLSRISFYQTFEKVKPKLIVFVHYCLFHHEYGWNECFQHWNESTWIIFELWFVFYCYFFEREICVFPSIQLFLSLFYCTISLFWIYVSIPNSIIFNCLAGNEFSLKNKEKWGTIYHQYF